MNIFTDHAAVGPAQFCGRAAVVTLGCAKNQVDSEIMAGVLRKSGFEMVSDLTNADVAIVNTCGFLQSALKESIACILEVADYKNTARLRKLIVAGCAVERYRDELRQSLPEVDVFLTLEDVLKVGQAADTTASSNSFAGLLRRAGRPYFLYDDSMPRQLSTRRHTAYIKIAEGCDRSCSFCIIPKIRGAMRSRPLDSIVREAAALGAQGVREVNLIAQDLTSYGRDLKGPNLAALLRALDAAKCAPWIRLLYSYPVGITQELLRAIVELPRVVEYLDIPLQHTSERLLSRMRRPLGRLAPRRLVEFIHAHAPALQLRTTFIVGFPQEDERDIDGLAAFIEEGHFSSVGVFCYSAEPGTPAALMKGQLPERVKKSRRERLMRAQQKVVAAKLRSYIGSTLEVLIEGTHEDTDLLLTGRTRFQAPEVDGAVLINDIAAAAPAASETAAAARLVGEISQVEISDVAGYDLIGSLKAKGYR